MEQRFKLYMKYVEALYHGKLIIKIILSIPLKIFIETDRKKIIISENENLLIKTVSLSYRLIIL